MSANAAVQFADPTKTRTYCQRSIFYCAFVTTIITSVLLLIFLVVSCFVRASTSKEPVPPKALD